MKKQLAYTAFFLLIGIASFAGVGDYAVSKIPAALLEKTSAVKRFEFIRFEVKDPGSAVYYYKRAITILNEGGDEYADWTEGYDKFSSIKSVDANLYDAAGNKIRSIKKADVSDLSGTSAMSLADDNRIKHHNFSYKIYPYTIEYEVTIEKKGLMFMPVWSPLEDEDVSVETGIFEIVCPGSYDIRYKAFQYNKEPIVTNAGLKTYHWEINNTPAIKNENFTPSRMEITPTIFTAATTFEVEGYRGVMNSWSEFGKFQCQLNKGRDMLPKPVLEAIHKLADTISDPVRKVALLYKYMQDNTRYISIQLGIGGWQPLEASFVGSKGYGDCKALTNYMYSILKAVGIKSCYTTIKAGEGNNFYLPDFPSRQSNHAILAVPMQKDTMWLECTSQINPAGYLGSFTDNRYALIIDDDGGHLVRTPRYIARDNLQTRDISAIIDVNGKLTAAISTLYTGQQQDRLFSLIMTQTKKEQLEYLKKEIDLPNYDISSFNYTVQKGRIPSVDERISLVADNYAQVTGKRLFIQPNLLSKSGFRPVEGERKFDIDLISEFRDIDSVEITVPDGYVAEAMPEPLSVSNKFGEYNISYKVEGNKILLTRLFERKSGRFPKADYPELVKMYNDIYKADRRKVVLVKKEG